MVFLTDGLLIGSVPLSLQNLRRDHIGPLKTKDSDAELAFLQAFQSSCSCQSFGPQTAQDLIILLRLDKVSPRNTELELTRVV